MYFKTMILGLNCVYIFPGVGMYVWRDRLGSGRERRAGTIPTMMDFVSKMMDFVSKMMDFVSKMMDSAFK